MVIEYLFFYRSPPEFWTPLKQINFTHITEKEEFVMFTSSEKNLFKIELWNLTLQLNKSLPRFALNLPKLH